MIIIFLVVYDGLLVLHHYILFFIVLLLNTILEERLYKVIDYLNKYFTLNFKKLYHYYQHLFQ